MTKSETQQPYLTYGLGYEEDERLIGEEPFHDDVLDLAKHLIEKHPKERWSIMHMMFSIGFNCGQRSTDSCFLSDEELYQHARKLTSVSNQIRIIESLLENIEYSRTKKDEFAVRYQIQSGLLGDINTSLSELKETVQQVSNDICPD